MTYWLDLFTGKSWREFIEAGADVSGFRINRSKTVQRIKVGDRLICYITGISRFAGILEVTSSPFEDNSKIWTDDIFPCRVKVKPLVTLDMELALPVFSMRSHLSVFQNLKSPGAWTGHFRGSPAKWALEDGDKVYEHLLQAKANPVVRKVDDKKLNYRPKLLKSKFASVAIPEPDIIPILESNSSLPESTAHDKIQKCLVKLGGDLGLDVWIARNDRNRIIDGKKLSDLPKTISILPIHFDEATTKTIELIDVLWLKGKTIVAAFEIESTTSIYSGLLRLADLISMQPNINIPLYIVAPDERRQKVMSEISRPTFSRLEPPMREMCSFLPFTALQDRLAQVKEFVNYLKPDFIEELAEFCEDLETEESDPAA